MVSFLVHVKYLIALYCRYVATVVSAHRSVKHSSQQRHATA